MKDQRASGILDLPVVERLAWAIFIGWGLAVVIMLTAYYLLSGKEADVLLWNVKYIISLAPRGLMGYDKQGDPIYEGTPLDLFFVFFGFLSSFFIYPVIVFLIMTVADKCSPKKKLAE